MKCNPLRWLWGLIPILMLSWISVLGAEHVLYPHALRLVASGAAVVNGDHVRLSGEPPVASTLYSPTIPTLR